MIWIHARDIFQLHIPQIQHCMPILIPLKYKMMKGLLYLDDEGNLEQIPLCGKKQGLKIKHRFGSKNLRQETFQFKFLKFYSI